MAACEWAGPHGAASHRAAAALWELDGVGPGIIEITSTVRTRRPGIVWHHTKALPSYDLSRRYSIPVTTPTRTVIDLAAVSGPTVVEAALDSALRRWLTSVPLLEDRMKTLGKRRGIVTLRTLVAEREEGNAPTDSHLEADVAKILRDFGLPVGQRQYWLTDGSGRKVRLDIAYPEIKAGIEVESVRWHSSRPAWEADIERHNFYVSLGWRVIRVTYRQLKEDPALFASRVRKLLNG